MRTQFEPWFVIIICLVLNLMHQTSQAQEDAPLPQGVKAVWDMNKAYREATPTRERVCINGLWRWQPAQAQDNKVPSGNWGYFKVPGSWPGISNYMQKDCQTVYAHPSWKDHDLRGVTAAWYQREITVPSKWANRRITLCAEYLNSFAAVYVNGEKVGEMRFPAGEVDLTSVCRPGGHYRLSVVVVAMPLKGVMLSYNDTASAKEVKGSVARRGLCGDVFLVGDPAEPSIADVKIDTSVRQWKISFDAALQSLQAGVSYAMLAEIMENDRVVKEFKSPNFTADKLQDGRIAFTERWRPEKLWDTHTPQNMYDLRLSLTDAGAKVLDTFFPIRFGFREFWIDGRDFYLNGARIFLSSVPFDNAQVGAAWACYDGARQSLERLQSFGINFVYTHNYGCQPGSHLSFSEILRACDDVGMLVALSQPHFGHYEWEAADADESNGYARHAEFYVRVAQNHPSVVAYSTSHNATGYGEDMNPDMIDGIRDERGEWSTRNVKRALRAEAIIKRLDPSRIVYHHSSGNLSSMHTVNFYPNFVPIQEMSDWFEHWATKGVKPVFLCEYGAPFTWDWAMYRGWFKGSRSFGSAVVPWEFCLAEWNSQFFGDRAFQISEMEKENLRWEAERFRTGSLWHRWDYPHQLGSRDFDERYPVLAMYLTDNWRAFRTWGVSAISPWQHGVFWKQRPGMDRNKRVELKTDWAKLQRPGLSPDFIEDRYERMDLAYKRTDWVATPAAEAMYRNNMPLLAYIAGKPERFTSKDHNFLPGETVSKQLIMINNSRVTVKCESKWSFELSQPAAGERTVEVAPGQQERIPLHFDLPANLRPGGYELKATFAFSTGEAQRDSFVVHVLPRTPRPKPAARIALFDPAGETRRVLDDMGVRYQAVESDTDLAAYNILIIGKAALTAYGPAPKIAHVRDGLKVICFEQTSEALEKRLGFRVEEYGLRRVFPRVAGHPVLTGLSVENLRDWRGEATILPPRLKYELNPRFSYAPTVRWCGIPVTRLWRCGNRGNVASVLIEKPACGDFLPILDGGYSLQFSPLMEYREGRGMVLFCQMDVIGRTESDPAAEQLLKNVLSYVSSWRPSARRQALYVGDSAGRRHLNRAGVSLGAYKGEPLTEDQVLIVGQGGGETLAEHRESIAQWLKAGGHLIAIEIDEGEANSFLPSPIHTKKVEHIAAYFEPFGVDSPFVGVSPADVHNRAPRQLPLVSGGAAVVGDGVLAQAAKANVVFCQLAPYNVTKAQGALPSLVASEGKAVAGERSALLTMGTVAWGQFGQKVKAGRMGKTYTFAVLVKGVDGPVRLRLEVERAANPWDRAVRGEDILIGAKEWTELHVTFKVDKDYPEGWSAYIHCGQEGARFRADLFRLYEGSYVPARGGTKAAAGAPNLFENPSFEAGVKPWWFSYRTEQYNLRRTYRRASFLLTRLLSNMGVSGETPLLARFSTPIGGAPKEPVVKNGDFRMDADGDGMPAPWRFSTNTKQAACVLEEVAPGAAERCLRITCPGPQKGKSVSVMLAQYDVPVTEGQWYRISLKAKSKGLKGARVTLALQNTAVWRSLFEYQHFAPREEWKEFAFFVQANATVESKTRFQIWHGNAGTIWLSDIRMAPCNSPSEGRWASGLYLDEPEEIDDPYRFFRW